MFSILLLLLTGSASATIQNLTHSTFWSFVQDHELSMVSYVSPQCKYCIDLHSEFDQAAAVLEPRGVPFIRVDCTLTESLCGDVPIFPTLRIFHYGHSSVYHGIRTAEAMSEAMHRHSMPLITELESTSEVESFRKQDKVTVVGYFDNLQQGQAKANFSKVAETLRDRFSFGVISDVDFGRHYHIRTPSVIAFKNFAGDSSVDTFKEVFTLEAMQEFLENSTVPCIAELGLDVKLSSPKLRDRFTAYLYASTREERRQLAAKIEPVASHFQDRIQFVTIDPHDKSPVAVKGETFGFAPGAWPALGVTDPGSRERTFVFPEQGSFDALFPAAIEIFLKSVLDGSAEPRIKTGGPVEDSHQVFWSNQARIGSA